MTGDRERWNARYAAGAYETITHPCAYLEANIDSLPMGHALDLACGAGRNALFLATKGYRVDAVDISDVALARAASDANNRGLTVNWIEADLADGDRDLARQLAAPYDLIINIRYVDLELARQATTWLAPGGAILIEQHLQDDSGAELAGPGSDRFRVPAGALEATVAGLSIQDSYEGYVTDPDGKTAALARIIAWRGTASTQRHA